MELSQIEQAINRSIRKLDFWHYLKSLDNQYRFTFRLQNILNLKLETYVTQFCKTFFKGTLYKIYQNNFFESGKNIDFIAQEMIYLDIQLKQCYYTLVQKCLSKKRSQKIHYLMFLISLASKNIVMSLLEDQHEELRIKIETNKVKELQNSAPYNSHTNLQMQEEVYIILIFKTLGNLISLLTFTTLKKKYIQQTLLLQNQNESTFRNITTTMKFIRQNLNKKQNLVKNRRERQKYSIILADGEIDHIGQLKKQLKTTTLNVVEASFASQISDISSKNNLKNQLNLYSMKKQYKQNLQPIKKRRFQSQTLSSSTGLLLKDVPQENNNKFSMIKNSRNYSPHGIESKIKFSKILNLNTQHKTLKKIKKIKDWPEIIEKIKVQSARQLSLQKLNSAQLSLNSLNTTHREPSAYFTNSSKTIQFPTKKFIYLGQENINDKGCQQTHQTISEQNSKYFNIQVPGVYGNCKLPFTKALNKKTIDTSKMIRNQEKNFNQQCNYRKKMIQGI